MPSSDLRGFRYDCYPDNRLARVNDLPELGLHPGRDIWNQLTDRPPKVFLSRYSVDLSQPVIDVNESKVRVEVAEADRQILVDARRFLDQVLRRHLIFCTPGSWLTSA